MDDPPSTPLPGSMPEEIKKEEPEPSSPLTQGLNLLGRGSMEVVMAPYRFGEAAYTATGQAVSGLATTVSDGTSTLVAEIDGSASKARAQKKKEEEAAIAMQKLARGNEIATNDVVRALMVRVAITVVPSPHCFASFDEQILVVEKLEKA